MLMKVINFILKWAVQICCMFGDILLLISAIILGYTAITLGNVIFFVIALFLLFKTYDAWKSQGGLIAWTHKKQFMENWDKMTKNERQLKRSR